MSEQNILEMEQLLLTANAAVVKLTLVNTELATQLSDAESRNKKLKRSGRREESAHRQELLIAQNRRG